MDISLYLAIILSIGELIGLLIFSWLSSPMLKVMWYIKRHHLSIDPEMYLPLMSGSKKEDINELFK